jgi:transposase InsO family protein
MARQAGSHLPKYEFHLGPPGGWDGTPEYLVRDRDSVYGEIFTRRLRAMGIRDRPISPRSPWQNGHAERLIGSLRRECLDHVVVFGERHLRHVLFLYMDYYNRARTHLSLKQGCADAATY